MKSQEVQLNIDRKETDKQLIAEEMKKLQKQIVSLRKRSADYEEQVWTCKDHRTHCDYYNLSIYSFALVINWFSESATAAAICGIKRANKGGTTEACSSAKWKRRYDQESLRRVYSAESGTPKSRQNETSRWLYGMITDSFLLL